MEENNTRAVYCGFETSKGKLILKWNQYLKDTGYEDTEPVPERYRL
jgi:hypothetical protein